VEADRAVAIIGVTVLLSVFAHVLSATPLANRYGASDAGPAPAGGQASTQMPVRGLFRRHPTAQTTRPVGGGAAQ
jgi:sodium/hydrogen antiporter